MTIPKSVTKMVFGILVFDIVICLEFGYWDLVLQI